MLKKKNKFKPLYKQFAKLKENVQNRKKLLKFKKQKWAKLIQYYKRKLKRYKKFKPQDQTRYIVSKFPSKANSYKKRFKNTLTASKRFRLFYGDLSKKLVKKQIKHAIKRKTNKKFLNFYLIFLEHFEHRLDTILYRSKFSISLRNARQLIVHGKVLVNNKSVRIPSFKLFPGDLITINPKFSNLIEKNLKNSEIWPIPPKYLSINYKTMEIFINDNAQQTNLSTNYPFHLDLEKVSVNYYRH
jgi:small subunit ribosomal protein S4